LSGSGEPAPRDTSLATSRRPDVPPKISKDTLRKLQPKLRMVTDGDTTVNVLRAERAAALAVDKPATVRNFATCRSADSIPVSLAELKKKPKRPKALKAITGAVRANVFVYLRNSLVDVPELDGTGTDKRPNSRRGQIMQIQAPLNEIPAIARHDDVTYVEV